MARRRPQRSFELCELTANGPRLVCWITKKKADEMVSKLKAEAICDPDSGECLGYQLLTPAVAPAHKLGCAPVAIAKPSSSMNSTASFSVSELDIIAGAHMKGGENVDGVDGGRPGRSRTSGMNELARMERLRRGFPVEDRIERVLAKLEHYQTTH